MSGRSCSYSGVAAALVAAFLSGCGCNDLNSSPGIWDGIDTGGDWVGDTGGDTAVDPAPEIPGGDVEEELCGGTGFGVARVIPDMLILLDRSNSMADTPPSPALWETIRIALNNVTTPPRDAEIWFGLMTFPGPSCSGLVDQCMNPSSADVLVPVAAGNNDEVYTALYGGLATCGGTPIALSLESARVYLETLADGHPRYVLLATDGAPNCNAGITCPASECTNPIGGCGINPENCLDHRRTYDMLDGLCAAGIPTYILGMGGATDWAWVMGGMAAHGCTGDYYAADDPAGIADALDAIAGAVASCQFEMNCADIPDVNAVNFFSEPGHAPIHRNTLHDDGWDWVDTCPTGDGTGTVEFFGPACDAILSGVYESIGAEFGCPTIFI